MPNWCSNTLTIEGKSEQLQKLVTSITITENGSQSIRLTGLIPMPEVLVDTQAPKVTEDFDPDGRMIEWLNDPDNNYWTHEKYEQARSEHSEIYEKQQRAFAETGYHNWWDWQLANWGVKWGDCDTYLELGEVEAGVKHVDIRYDTPWGPFADNFWTQISKMWPELTFINCYYEDGMCFHGITAARNGEMLFTDHQEYPEPPEDLDFDDVDAWDKYNETILQARDEMECVFYEAHRAEAEGVAL